MKAEQRGRDRTRQRKIGRTVDRLRERARLRRGLGCLQGLPHRRKRPQGKAGAEGGGRKRVHHADRVDDRNRLQHLPRRRSVLAARCRVHGFEAHEPAMRRTAIPTPRPWPSSMRALVRRPDAIEVEADHG